MKKILAIILLTISILFLGCSHQNQLKKEDTNSNIGENEIFTESTNIEERYKLVNKENLKYTVKESNYYFYETANAFVESGLSSEIPNIDNKTYGNILTSYTYASEVNPTNVPYETAISLVKSILPDDIKEERIKHDPYSEKYYIVYSSSLGNFIVGLVPEDPMNPTNSPLSSKNIVGINYMKEIVN